MKLRIAGKPPVLRSHPANTNKERRFCFLPHYFGVCFVQTMNLLIVNQSVIDMFASLAVLTSVAQPDGTRMTVM